jgi:hypothetical protein
MPLSSIFFKRDLHITVRVCSRVRKGREEKGRGREGIGRVGSEQFFKNEWRIRLHSSSITSFHFL